MDKRPRALLVLRSLSQEEKQEKYPPIDPVLIKRIELLKASPSWHIPGGKNS